ncbi:MAG TPA: NAD(P)(+) transhydrogenase (Re/Si-specific) subunit beta [Kofleriaceae bacterium]|nr:NAD(P)(+) transhydrogenase (Re/Si-specific) subunit beta [Kofleriaceae bacterium]
MNLESIGTLVYVVAGVMFVLSLRGLSTPETARRGNLIGTIAMTLAVGVTAARILAQSDGEPGVASPVLAPETLGLLGGMIAVGCVVGALLAARVAMTAMPELVAILHSFVGAAAVLVGIATYMHGSHDLAHGIEVFVGVFVGAVTFSGSVIAFLKLRGSLSGKPLVIPGRHLLNLVLLGASVTLSVLGIRAGVAGIDKLWLVAAVAGLLGIHLVMAIGGGDMPVVVSLLNSYSGWAAAAAGFMLANDLLIITGALVGSSGAILSYIMCRAMNRSIWNVVFAGFGEGAGIAKGAAPAAPQGKVQETTTDEAADLLVGAKNVIIVPGYGMAVAQAQHPLKEVTSALQAKGVRVRYAIHPVAGRLPGHMNVLLAEANVSYDIVKEMEEINEDFAETDVVLVIGANDIVNPSALEDTSSPIYGMPVLEAWRAAKVIMMKRGLSAGYAGVDNPLVYKENTLMYFGDAKKKVLELLAALQSR